MYITLFYVSFVILTALILYQDLKYRSLHVSLMVTLGLLLIPYHLLIQALSWIDILLNIAYVALLLIISFIVISLRGKKVKEAIGLGDVLFIIIVSAYFDFPGFMLIINVSLIVSLVLHLLLLRVSKTYCNMGLIPLAGFQAPVFALAMIFNHNVQSISSYIQ